MRKPLVSVVMPVYNAVFFVKEAIVSVLKQTYENFEFIIIDDGSTDATVKNIKRFRDKRIRLFKNGKNIGISESLNKGILYARGKYIARMDADDIANPDRLKEQINFLERNTNIAMVGCWVELINVKGKSIGFKKPILTYNEIRKTIFRYNPFLHSTLVFRKKNLSQVGNYNKYFEGAEDYDIVFRILTKFKAANIPKILLKYRINKNSVTSKYSKKTEFQSLKLRIYALYKYHYSILNSFYLIKPFFSFLIPAYFKRWIFLK